MKWILILLITFNITGNDKIAYETIYINKLKEHEGYAGKYPNIRRPKNAKSDYGSYYDSLGFKTTGYGHLMKPNDKIKYPNYDMDNLTKEQAEKILIDDIKIHDLKLERHIKAAKLDTKKIKRNHRLYNCLRNITFQMGGLPNTLKKIGSKKWTWKYAAKKMRSWKWYKQSGKRAKDMVKIIERGL